MNGVKTLAWELTDIPFVSRETSGAGKPIKFRCNRDFIFYALTFYQRNKNAWPQHPEQLEYKPFGIKLPFWLMWTMFHVVHTPRILADNKLILFINDHKITSWWSYWPALLWPRPVSFEAVLSEIETAIDHNIALGIDISVALGGLVDHILFVYGYDDGNLYVLDTQQLPMLPYVKVLVGERFLMKLPKSALPERLGRFSRLWNVVPQATTQLHVK